MAKILHHSVGDLWSEPTATFTVGGTPQDPTTITVRLQDNAGVESVLYSGATGGLIGSSTPVAKTGTGVYKLNPGVALTAAGYWFVKFEGTAGVVATIQWQTTVDPDEFVSDGGLSTRALVGLAETKDWLQQQNIQYGEDLELVRVINDVSDRIHYEAAREFKSYDSTTSPTTRIFPVSQPWCRGITLGVDLNALGTTPAVQFVSALDFSTVIANVANTDINLLPLNREPWQPARALLFDTNVPILTPQMRVKVTANWGFPQVPGNIRQAALDTIAVVMDRAVEHYRSDLATPVGGSGATVVFAQRPTVLSLPPGAYSVVRSYRPQIA